MRVLVDAKRSFARRPRHMTTAERRALQRAIANDPEVDRVLREFLAERPEFRRKDAREGGVQDQSG
jgi:hypothetical protein